MIPNQHIEVQTSPVDYFSVPCWFTEVVILTQHLAIQELFEAFAHNARLVRGHSAATNLLISSPRARQEKTRETLENSLRTSLFWRVLRSASYFFWGFS